MPISPRPTRDTTGPPRPSVVVFITPAPYRPGPGRYGLRSGEAVDLVHVCARDAERGVVLADGVLVGPVKQAVHLAVGVVVQLDLAHAELVGLAVAGVLGDLRDSLGWQFQVVVEVHELRHPPCSFTFAPPVSALALTVRTVPDADGPGNVVRYAAFR